MCKTMKAWSISVGLFIALFAFPTFNRENYSYVNIIIKFSEKMILKQMRDIDW